MSDFFSGNASGNLNETYNSLLSKMDIFKGHEWLDNVCTAATPPVEERDDSGDILDKPQKMEENVLPDLPRLSEGKLSLSDTKDLLKEVLDGDDMSLTSAVSLESTTSCLSLDSNFNLQRLIQNQCNEEETASEEVVSKKIGDFDSREIWCKDRYNLRGDFLNSHSSKLVSPEEKVERDRVATKKFNEHRAGLKEIINDLGQYHRYSADKLILMGDCNQTMERYERALKCYLEALLIYSTKLGDDSVKAMDTRIKIGKVQLERGEYEDALEAYCHALYIRAARYGQNHPSVAHIHEQLCVVHCEKNQPVEAVKDMKRALRAYREAYGDENLRVVSTVESIASIYMIIGNLEKAACIFAEAVKLKMATLGKGHPDIASSLTRWGATHEKLGDTHKAMKIMKKAYSILEHKSSETVYVLGHIGNLYAKTGRIEKAMKTHMRALKLKKEKFKHDHPEVADTLVDIGAILIDKGRTEKASRCMNEALVIYRKFYGDNHVTIADTLGHIAKIYENENNFDKSLQAYTRVLYMRKNVLGEHAEIGDNLRHIGRVYLKNGDLIMSLNTYAKSLGVYGNTTGRSTKYAETLYDSGVVLQKMGDNLSALEAYKEALRINRDFDIDESNPEATKIMDNLKETVGQPNKVKSKYIGAIARIQPYLRRN